MKNMDGQEVWDMVELGNGFPLTINWHKNGLGDNGCQKKLMV
jgi:hypothetical protein